MDVAIVGAGLYGHSIASHLNRLNVPYRVFGRPMQSWQTKLPKGMFLKSGGFASGLHDPESGFTLRHYCAETNRPYADVGIPVPLETFTAYGIEFQKRIVPSLEQVDIASVDPIPQGFELTTEMGERFRARRVVAAAGSLILTGSHPCWPACRASLSRTAPPMENFPHSKGAKLWSFEPERRPLISL